MAQETEHSCQCALVSGICSGFPYEALHSILSIVESNLTGNKIRLPEEIIPTVTTQVLLSDKTNSTVVFIHNL
jgi:hypothetical protein